MDVDSRLLKSSPALIGNFVLEMTDKCNLRCVYCHQNLADFQAKRDMSEKMVMRIMEYFTQVKPPFINLTGAGDLLMAPEWHKQCARMLEYGIPLRTTVNLGKMLSQEECEVLARFSLITVSIDNVDQQTLKQYRKSVDIRTIAYNILMIKSAARRLGIAEPEWVISAVYYVEIVSGLEDVALFASSIGAGMFGLQDLMEYDPIENNVTPVWVLRGNEAMQAVEDTRKAIATAKRLGLALCLPGDFTIRLEHLEKEAHNPITEMAA